MLAVCATSGTARTYRFRIRQGYTQCATCHTDPSGGTLLNEYGRAQSELLLSSSYGGGGDSSDSPDAEPTAGRFLGFVQLPSWLRLGGWVREGYLWNAVDGPFVDRRFLQMRALRGGLDPKGSSSRAPRVEDPQFGCNASGRGGGSVWGLILAVGLRVAASRLARRR